MLQLEKRKRHTCPKCQRSGKFTRFIDTESSEYLPDHVGICNRDSICGYRYLARDFFRDNPGGQSNPSSPKPPARTKKSYEMNQEAESFDLIPEEKLAATLGNYSRNNFVDFLFNLFPADSDAVQAALKKYLLGTYLDSFGNYFTCFPYLDRRGQICRANLVRYNANGSRLRGEFDTSSLHSRLKVPLPADQDGYKYKQTFFGEHLLAQSPASLVVIVESEKSAVIGSICYSEYIWLGSFSKTWLNANRLESLGTRQILLYPDTDGYQAWKEIADQAQRMGLSVRISELLEKKTTEAEKSRQMDIADYLIREQRRINKLIKEFDDKIDRIINDEFLLNQFNTIIEEQIAIAVEAGTSEAAAEQIAVQPENIRKVVCCL